MFNSTMMPTQQNTEPRHDDEGRHHRQYHRHNDQELETAEFQSVYHQVLNNAGGCPNNHSTLSVKQQQQQQQELKQKESAATDANANDISVIVITEYTAMDILSGRGGLANKHAGNRVYRRLIDLNKPLYRKLSTKTRKSQLVESILRAIEKHGGRFLKQQQQKKTRNANKHQTSWFEIDYKEAFAKTCQALREPSRSNSSSRRHDLADPSESKDSSSASCARPSAGTEDASSSSTPVDNEDDDDEEDEEEDAGTDNDEVMNEDDGHFNDDQYDYNDHDNSHINDVLNSDSSCGVKELSDEDMAMLLRASSTSTLLRRASSAFGDWSVLEQHAGDYSAVSVAAATSATAASHYHYQRQYAARQQHDHHNHHHDATLGMPTTRDLLDGESYYGAVAGRGAVTTTRMMTTNNNTTATQKTNGQGSVMKMSNGAPSSPLLQASLLHLAANNNNNNNRMPPIPESLMLRMDTSRAALGHLLYANSNDNGNHHYQQHINNNNNNNMPAPLEPLTRMRSSVSFFPAALDAILLRQDSLDFSVAAAASSCCSHSLGGYSSSMNNTEQQQQQYEDVNFESI